jgi:hypothetical protein
MSKEEASGSSDKIVIECYKGHLEGFARHAELANAVMRWLKETSRR